MWWCFLFSLGRERTELFIYLWLIRADLLRLCGCKWTERPGLFEDGDRLRIREGAFLWVRSQRLDGLALAVTFVQTRAGPHDYRIPRCVCVWLCVCVYLRSCSKCLAKLSVLSMCVVCRRVHGHGGEASCPKEVWALVAMETRPTNTPALPLRQY